jgi:hypothetical protein
MQLRPAEELVAVVLELVAAQAVILAEAIMLPTLYTTHKHRLSDPIMS